MSRSRIVVLVVVILALVAIGHHQLAQLSNQALNTTFVTEAQATATPTPTVTPTPTPAPIGESCTFGFYKNHTGFINGGSCVSGVTKDTLVSTIFGSVGSSCVFNLTLLEALKAQAGQSGPCPNNNAQINLMHQAIAAWLNATTSSPSACAAAAQIVVLTDQAIVAGDAAMDALKNFLETNINNDKIGRCVD